MEASKGRRLRPWLCKLLRCDALCEAPPSKGPKVVVKGNRETFVYDGYDIEVQLLPEHKALVIQAFLKGGLVLTGYCYSNAAPDWTYTIHLPSYKTRKYIQEWALNRLTNMKDRK